MLAIRVDASKRATCRSVRRSSSTVTWPWPMEEDELTERTPPIPDRTASTREVTSASITAGEASGIDICTCRMFRFGSGV